LRSAFYHAHHLPSTIAVKNLLVALDVSPASC